MDQDVMNIIRGVEIDPDSGTPIIQTDGTIKTARTANFRITEELVCEHAVKKARKQFLKDAKKQIQNDYTQIGNLSEEEQIDDFCVCAIRTDYRALGMIINQIDKYIKMAIRLNVDALSYVRDQTDAVCKDALNVSKTAIKFIRNPSRDVLEYAFKKYDDCISLLENPSNELCVLAVTCNPNSLYYMKKEFHTKEICTISVTKNIMMFQYCEYQDEELCVYAVTHYWLNLKFVRNKTDAVYKRALNANYKALDNVDMTSTTSLSDDKIDEYCKIAIASNGLAIQFINPISRRRKYYLDSVKSNGDALEHIPESERTDELCEEAVKNGSLDIPPQFPQTMVQKSLSAIRFITNQTRELCLLALDANPRAYKSIHNKTEELSLYAVRKSAENIKLVPIEHYQYILVRINKYDGYEPIIKYISMRVGIWNKVKQHLTPDPNIESNMCPICLDDEGTFSRTKCGHLFHDDCLKYIVISASANGKLECTICKKSLR